jgi:hypothetical protein
MSSVEERMVLRTGKRTENTTNTSQHDSERREG